MQRCLLGLIGSLLLAEAGWAAQEITPVPEKPIAPSTKVCLEGIPSPQRERVKELMEHPTLHARGNSDTFTCQPSQYNWVLDNPHKAVVAWRRLGARCVSIVPRGQGKFGWADENGSEVVWETVIRAPNQRVWLAEGKVKAGPLLPMVPVKAVVVLNYQETRQRDGTTTISHQATLYAHTDSKSAALVTKVLGHPAQRTCEYGMDQFQLFFSGLSKYMFRHPDQLEALLEE